MSGANISQWIQDNVITLILILIAAVVLWAGKSGNVSKVVTIVGASIVGLVWLALATTGAGARLGEWIVSLVVV